jgi:hypothetical protein
MGLGGSLPPANIDAIFVRGFSSSSSLSISDPLVSNSDPLEISLAGLGAGLSAFRVALTCAVFRHERAILDAETASAIPRDRTSSFAS